MANTYVDYTATAGQTDFNFSFPYLENDHVEVFIDGVKSTAFTISLSPTRIVLDTAATGGEVVRVRRSSDPTEDLVDFVNGSILTESDLDRAYLHNRYLNEEAYEGNTSSLQTAAGSTNFDANFNKIVNLAPPTSSTDAANKNYVDDKLALSGTSLSGFNKSTHTGDNATTTFNLSFTPQTGTAAAFRVAIDGVLQTPDDAYTVDNGASTITFTSAPPTNAEIVVIATGTAQDVNSIGITATGSTTARSLANRFADVVNLKDFGAVGNGTTDDTDALQAAFTYAVNNGLKIVDKSNSTYRFTSNIIVSGANKKFELDTNSTFVGESAYIDLTGSLTTIGSISAATTVGGNTFSCANASGLSEGDIVILHDHTTSSFSAHRSYYYNGEFNEVRGVSGTTVTVNGALNTAYDGVSTDEVYKLNPIEVVINGGVFDTTGVYGIRVKYGKNVRLNVQKVKAESTTASAALTLNKCYDVIVEGGIFTLPYASSSTSMYGIGVANSQNVTISSVDSYAYRHAVSTGGDDENGSVPCRNIIIKDSTLKNDSGASTYNADFHGNTVNSIYKNCVITGGIGLAGSHVSAEDCIVFPHSETNDVPLALHEVVGGVIKFKGCKVYLPPSSSPDIVKVVVGTVATAINANIDAAYTVHVEDLYVASQSYLTRIVQAYSNSGRSNKWILNGFNIAGDISGLTSIVQYNLDTTTNPSNPGIDADLIEIKNPRSSFNVPYLVKAGTTLSNTTIILPTQKGSNSNGEYVKFPDGTMICRFRQDTDIAISTAFLGGFRSSGITWTYPESFVDVPDVSGIPTGATASGICGSTISSSSALYFVLAFSSQTSATRQVHLTAIGRWF